ncbi:Cornifelin -like protein [Brachionus plicatilis]|uniref:Cornifelin-like protein n=1 Tax=Brachionus plicatilis TaxID=10195 RepID=A0A3M7SIF2_BRAPC|nr:Cornifelin -like protein [Brachionus plicatilis]
MIIVEQPGNEWQYPLFDCFYPVEDCLLAYFCAPCYAAYAADESGESLFSSILQFLCYPLGLLYLRPTARYKHYIDGSLFKDFCAVILFPCCVSMQIRKEFEDGI